MKKFHLAALLLCVVWAVIGCDKKNPSGDDTPDDVSGAVDIGLSVKWADRNIGAATPEDYGDYYAWGEVETKDDYAWETYRLCEGSLTKLTKYNFLPEYGTTDSNKKLITGPDGDDVASVKLGGKWRMPTYDDVKELFDTSWENPDYKWETIDDPNGHGGWKITYLVNGNSIFLPFAGKMVAKTLMGAGTHFEMWTSSLSEHLSYYAWSMNGHAYGVSTETSSRDVGRTVRAVHP